MDQEEMPSRSSRRLQRKSPGDGGDDSDSGGQIIHDDADAPAELMALSEELHVQVPPSGEAADASSSDAFHQCPIAAADDDIGESSAAAADQATVFRPYPSEAERSIEVQIRNDRTQEDEGAASAASMPSAPPDYGQASTADVPPAASLPAHASAQAASAVPFVAPPIVTKTTRRETFESAILKGRRKKKPSEGKSLLQNPSTSSSEDDNSMMELFSPPPSTSLRTRPRPTDHQDVDLMAAVTTSASMEQQQQEAAAVYFGHREPHHQADHETHAAEPRGPHVPLHYQPPPAVHLAHSYESPPTIYTPHAVQGDRMAVSTTQRRNYQGRVVHVPHQEGEEDEQQQQAAEGGREGEREGEQPQPQKPPESAPAKLPVS